VLPNILRLVGLAVVGAGASVEPFNGFSGFDALDRLAAQNSPASETLPDALPHTSALRNVCRQRLGLDDAQLKGAQILAADDANLLAALQRASQAPFSVLEGRCGDLLWAVALAPSVADPAEVRLALAEASAAPLPAGEEVCRQDVSRPEVSYLFLRALWQIHDRFRLLRSADGVARRMPWICGEPAGRSLTLALADATLLLSEGAPDAARTRWQRRRSHELIVLAAHSRSELIRQIQALRASPAQTPRALIDLAAQCAERGASSHGPLRAAIVASDLDDLAQKLDLLGNAIGNEKLLRYAHPRGVWATFAAPDSGKLAFVFPGQGAQYFGMLADSALYLDSVRQWFDLLDAHYPATQRPSDTLYGPPDAAAAERLHALAHGGQACLTAALALSEFLEMCGVHPDFMVGHSNGENAAIMAAFFAFRRPRAEIVGGLKSLEHLFSGADRHNPHAVGRGSNVALTLPDPEIRPRVLALLAGRGYVSIDNCPAQLLVHLLPASVESVLAEMAALGVTALRLPFDQAFHTPLFGEHAEQFTEAHRQIDDSPMRAVLYSAATVAPFPADAPGRCATAAAQWKRTVRFRETTRRLYDDGARIFVDVGAAGRLTGFVRDTLRGEAHSALACDAESGSGYAMLLRTLGQLFVAGKVDRLEVLFAGWQAGGATPIGAERHADPVVAPTAVSSAIPFSAPANVLPDAPSSASPTASFTTPNPQALYLVQRHFALMREFLDSQSRVMSAVVARLMHGPDAANATNAKPVPTPAAERRETPALPDALSLYFPHRLADPPGDNEKPAALRWQVTLDLACHGFLGQHCFGKPLTRHPGELTGLAVSPMVFSIEMCAAAAQRANGGGVVSAVAACRGYQWVTVAQASRVLQLEAQRLTPSSINAWAVRLCGEQGDVLFACTVELAAAYPPAPPAQAEDHVAAYPPSFDLAAFNTLTFHGAGYRAMRAIRSLTRHQITVDAEVPSFAAMIADATDARALATPAPLLDTQGQLTALFALQSRSNIGLFPVSIERIAFFAPPASSGEACTLIAACEQTNDTVRADIDVVDARGALTCRISGAEQRIFDWGPTFRRIVFSSGHNEPFAAISRLDGDLWCATLADIDARLLASSNGLWLEVVARCVLAASERAAWAALTRAAMARKISWLLGRIAGKSALLAALRSSTGADGAGDDEHEYDYADIAITNLACGAPQAQLTHLADGAKVPTLSISHCNGCAVALVSSSGGCIGIDVEPADALAELGHLAKEIVAADGAEDAALQHVGLLRLWCAKEAAAKAAGSGLRGRPDAWLTRHWQLDDEGWTAQVFAPPEMGNMGDKSVNAGENFFVRLFEADGRVMAIARESSSGGAIPCVAGSAQR
jgi:malonyl CoA-acyl carrier protein transacylase/phosphopantetheinyl transferase (holo-ACP synthase)